jgi:hypothetical protein
MGRFWGCALVLGLVGIVGHAAYGNPDDKAKAKAGELVKQAIAKSQAGDHTAAIELYQQAYMLVPQPLLLSNIGSEYQKSGKPVEAVKNFCKYLAEDPTGANVDYATAQVKTLQIELKNDVEETDPCKAKPKPLPPPTPPVADQQPLPPPPPPPASRTVEYAGFGIAGAGAIMFGVGVYYGLQAKKISDDITNHPIGVMWPSDIKQQEADGKSDQTKQIVFMVAGGVALAGGVAVALYGRSRASTSEHVSIAPMASPTTLGVAVGGGF